MAYIEKEKMVFSIMLTLLLKKSTYGYCFSLVLRPAPKITGAVDYLCSLCKKKKIFSFV